MIIKNGDTKGVTAPKSGDGGTGIFGNTAAGNWWAKQSTGVVRPLFLPVLLGSS